MRRVIELYPTEQVQLLEDFEDEVTDATLVGRVVTAVTSNGTNDASRISLVGGTGTQVRATFMSGGTSGEDYTVTMVAVLNNQTRLERKIEVRVRNESID